MIVAARKNGTATQIIRFNEIAISAICDKNTSVFISIPSVRDADTEPNSGLLWCSVYALRVSDHFRDEDEPMLKFSILIKPQICNDDHKAQLPIDATT